MGLALVAVDVFIAVGTSVSARRSRSSSFIVERLVSALVLGLARHTKPFPLGRKFILLLDWISSRRVEVHGIRKQRYSWHVNGRARAPPIFKSYADNEARGPLMKGPVAIGPLINSFSAS